MKKSSILVTIALAIIAFQLNLYSEDQAQNSFGNHSKHEFLGKIGTSFASDPGKFGLDASCSYMYEIDPYFAFGGSLGFFWINWSDKIGEEQIGPVIADVEVETNAYTVPLFANAQVRLPDLLQSLRLEPSITVGFGYAVMFLSYTRPSYVDINTGPVSRKERLLVYGGFTWQVFASLAWRPSDSSAINFILDAGYRGLYPERENTQINLSGFITRVGVTIYL